MERTRQDNFKPISNFGQFQTCPTVCKDLLNNKISFSIPASELKHTMGKLGEELTDETVAGIVSGGDADRDGKLNYQEFLQIMDSDEVVVVLRK